MSRDSVHAHTIPEAEKPAIQPGAISAENCWIITQWWMAQRKSSQRATIPATTLNDVLLPRLAAAAAVNWHLPVTHCTSAVLGYSPGDAFPRHADLDPRVPNSPGRTVSVSVALNDSFTGGDLIVGDEAVSLGVGDACYFTANTFHEVTEVHTGMRFVAVAFGRCCDGD